MNEYETWHAETLGKKACDALVKNGFAARYVATKEEAAGFIEALVTPGMSVGVGGSLTLRGQMGILEKLERLGAKVLDHSRKGLSKEEKVSVMRAQLTCDLFLSSSNAVTLEGEIFNVDGNGNRVGALTFGPKKTVIVVGYNKIVRNMEEAEARLETVAAPMNNNKLGIANACTKTGVCMDCKADSRICRIYSVLKRKPSYSDITVVIVGEALGF